ncbi:DUF6296 family protein [Streptomyces sp. ML-6]|uniref:DUF6296 family protein n=1 Tax=unclassified Streptomyces TaxID=2593676 RepID=UPI0024C0B7F0|nr:DUF6296 family protein [Streptomyces sp. ML-6]MDK0523036.1 DUF6296 family protein [Streptomyces sp. ML-6]
MDYPESYQLVFQASAVEDDTVTVWRTAQSGAGGHPVYEDETGIVRAEINDRGEVRMLASGGHQMLGTPTVVREVEGEQQGAPPGGDGPV